MNKKLFLILSIGLQFYTSLTIGQDKILSPAFKKSTILKIDTLLQQNYVFPEVAVQIGNHLKSQLEKGTFNQFTVLDSFANALTKELRVINNDKHLGVWSTINNKNPKENIEDAYSKYHTKFVTSRNQNNGFLEAKKMEGNIGYLNILSFPNLAEAKETIDAYMKLISTTDALIIDLRNNGGGNADAVNYFSSYFLDKKTLLFSLYEPKNNKTTEFWSVDQVSGKRIPTIPLFILIGKSTFSGAESFSYSMQALQRGMVIGQSSAGAAHIGYPIKANDSLEIYIPFARGINSITKTDWEGVGVIPDVKIEADNTYTKALELATIAAQQYREKSAKQSQELYDKLQKAINQIVQNLKSTPTEQALLLVMKECIQSELYNEGDFLFFGSQYQQNNQFVETEILLKNTTVLFPQSPFAFLHYADILEINKKKTTALKTLEKAINLATEQKAPYLDGLKRRYEQMKSSK